MLRLMSTLHHVVLNGRYELSTLTPPYTWTGSRRGATDPKSIIDYFSIAKCHYHKVSRCTILPTKTADSDFLSDHNPLILTLTLPESKDTLTLPHKPAPQAPSRLTFHSNRLKTPETKEAFSSALETLITRDSPKVHRLTTALKGKTIPI